MEKRWVQIEISTELLLNMLAFPNGTEVVACNGENAPLGTIRLTVSNPALPALPDGAPVPVSVPTLVRRKPLDVLSYLSELNPSMADLYLFDWGDVTNDT